MGDNLKTLFTYQSPNAEAIAQMAAIREKGYELSRMIYDTVPAGSDRAASIRHIREAVFTANAGIVLKGANL